RRDEAGLPRGEPRRHGPDAGGPAVAVHRRSARRAARRPGRPRRAAGRLRWPAMTSTTIPVGGERPYDVLVGRDLLGALPGLLPGAAQAAVLYAPPLKDYATRVADVLDGALPIEVPDAEAGKTIEVAARCWETLGAAGFTRSDAVVGVGGGAVTDL